MASAEAVVMTEMMVVGAGAKPPVAEAPVAGTPPTQPTNLAEGLFGAPVAQGDETPFELPAAEAPLPAESSPLAGLPEDVHVDGTNALGQVSAKGLDYKNYIGDDGEFQYEKFADAMGWQQNSTNRTFSEHGLQVYLAQHPDVAARVDQGRLAAELKKTHDIPADDVPALLEIVKTEVPPEGEAEELSSDESAFPHGQAEGTAEELKTEPLPTEKADDKHADLPVEQRAAPTVENPPSGEEKWRVEPSTFPPGEEPRDREAYLQTLQGVYQGNVDILIGTADKQGLLFLEQEHIAAEQARILAKKTELANQRRTEARRGRVLKLDKVLGVFGLKDKDSVIVAKARAELNSAQKAERATEAQKAQFLDQERYSDTDRKQFAALYKLEGLAADTKTSFSDMLVTARDAGIPTDGLATVDDIRNAVRHAPRNTRYQHFRTFYEGGEITIQGKEPIVIKRENGLGVLRVNTKKSEQTLADARAKEATTTRVISQLERRLSRHEQRLLNYQRRLARIARLIQDGYRPDMAVMRATWAELDNATLNHDGLAEEKRGKEKRVQAGTLTREQMLNSKTEDKNGKQRKLVDLIKEAVQNGNEVSTRLVRMRDPLRRLTEHEDLAQLRTELQRGLALRNATSERLAAEPRDVQMEAVIVRTLLGEMPVFQIGERTLLRRVAGAPTEPPTPPSGSKPKGGENPPVATSTVTGAGEARASAQPEEEQVPVTREDFVNKVSQTTGLDPKDIDPILEEANFRDILRQLQEKGQVNTVADWIVKTYYKKYNPQQREAFLKAYPDHTYVKLLQTMVRMGMNEEQIVKRLAEWSRNKKDLSGALGGALMFLQVLDMTFKSTETEEAQSTGRNA